MVTPPPLRYLSATDVAAAMPPLEERLALADAVMRGLAEGAELPPKIAVHPRPGGSFAHAMPAFMADRGPDTAHDRLGMKWVLGFPGNLERGLPAIHGLVLLNDGATGVPTAILDAGPITAQRTAAVSGVAIRAYRPEAIGRPHRVALIGAGVQGRSHLPVLGHVLPGLELRIFDRDRGRATGLEALAQATDGIVSVATAASARAAVEDADVVVTAAAFGPPSEAQSMGPDWLGPATLVVPIDYATYCSAAVARDADLFLVDQREQFLANRDAGAFDGYPEPDAMLGEALIAGTPRPAGRVVVTHLGVGLADVVFGQAIVRRATEMGLGIELPR